jgi:hypothetical protein
MCLDNIELMKLEKNKKKVRFSRSNIHLFNENIKNKKRNKIVLVPLFAKL